MIGVGIPATTTARGIGRVATSDDLVDGATITNGPAFLAAGSEAVTTTPAAHAVPQADANGKLDGWVPNKANTSLDNITIVGRSNIASLVSPGASKVAIAMPADGSTITSPGNGYLQLSSTPSVTAYFALFNMTSGLRTRLWGEYSGHSVDCFLPVALGDVVQVWCNTDQAKTLDFVPRKGN